MINMKKTVRKKQKKKMPFSFKLIVAWMVIAVISTVSKLSDSSRLISNQEVMGYGLAMFDYYMDFLILIAFIIFIILFLRRGRNTWKYFIWFSFFLILGVFVGLMVGIANAETLMEVNNLSESGLSTNFFVISIIASAIIEFLIYGLMIYFVRKNQGWFKK